MAGIIEVKDQGKLRIYDADNSNYVDIVVPSTVSSNRTITLPDASFTVPTADTVGGITMADQWRVTTGFTNSAAPIASNWERNDTTPALSYFGSQMTQSSGIFTFPSTGIYYVSFQANFKLNGDSRYNYSLIKGTTDGSTLITLTEAATLIQQTQSATTYASSNSEVMVDVTNTSNIKVAFEINVSNSSTETLCNTARDVTFARFIRLGDT